MLGRRDRHDRAGFTPPKWGANEGNSSVFYTTLPRSPRFGSAGSKRWQPPRDGLRRQRSGWLFPAPSSSSILLFQPVLLAKPALTSAGHALNSLPWNAAGGRRFDATSQRLPSGNPRLSDYGSAQAPTAGKTRSSHGSASKRRAEILSPCSAAHARNRPCPGAA